MSSERRLHPLSLLFALGDQLRTLVLPFLILLVTTRRLDLAYLIPLFFVAAAALAAFLRWFTFRYRFDERELVVRSGVLFRHVRHIPYERIQNLDVIQTAVQRVLGVALVNVQTGAGAEPEATFNVLDVRAVPEMRTRIASIHAPAAGATPPRLDTDAGAAISPPVEADGGTKLLQLSTRDLLLSGFIENRGMFLVLAAVGVLTQFAPSEQRMLQEIEHRLPWVGAALDAARQTIAEGALSFTSIMRVLTGLLVLLLFIRVLSMVWAAVRLHDYRLTRAGDDLRAEYGLLTRVTATIPLHRIQLVSIHESLLHRWCARAAVRVTTAGGGTGPGGINEREGLAPLIRVAELPAFLECVQPGLDLSVDWRPVHPQAFRRAFFMTAVRAVLIAAVAGFYRPWLAVPVLVVLLVRAAVRSRMLVRHLAWGVTSNAVVFRGGWMRRTTSAVRFSRMQSVALHESPFDRRTGMATIFVDAAGRRGMDMPYLPAEAAAELRSDLAGRAARATFTW